VRQRLHDLPDNDHAGGANERRELFELRPQRRAAIGEVDGDEQCALRGIGDGAHRRGLVKAGRRAFVLRGRDHHSAYLRRVDLLRVDFGRHRTPFAAVGAALIACACVLLAGASIGAVPFAFSIVVAQIIHPDLTTQAGRILWDIRIPRVAIAALVGAALGTAGTLLQTMLRNPLVDPYLTGTSAGAACAIAIGIAAGAATALLPLLAFAAALLTALLVAALARTGSGLSHERLILAGVSLSALFAGIVTLVILLSPRASTSLSILAWLGGSLAGRGWSDFRAAAGYAGIGAVLALALAPALNGLRFGESRARALGVDVDRAGWAILAAASLLTAAAVSVSGVVGFVGLIVPHVTRRIVGDDARFALVTSALVGAMLVVLADLVARSIAPPLDLPVGVLLSMFGVPVFIFLAFRRRTA
jgi:iron complex transport system permease protein